MKQASLSSVQKRRISFRTQFSPRIKVPEEFQDCGILGVTSCMNFRKELKNSKKYENYVFQQSMI